MPRPLRIEYPGAWYHVMNRGAGRIKIFITEKHKEIFLNLLAEISNLFQVEIHSYCLLDNHYHLLIRTPYPNLGRAIRHLSGIYTLRYNRSMKRDGPLFRGRYKAILIQADDYILNVSRYIHLNPTEARIVQQPRDFIWSSYNDYINVKRSNWLHTDYILNFFGNEKSYLAFVSEGIDDETMTFYERSQLASVLGSPKFITDKIDSLDAEYQFATQADINRIKKLRSMEEIANCICQYFAIPIIQLKTPRLKNNLPRILAIFLARNITQSSHQKISEFFTGIKQYSISTVLIKCRNLIETNPDIKMDYLAIRKLLKES